MQQNSNVVNLGEKNIRDRLLEFLQTSGLKQVDVSKETGIHHSTLSLWLQGKIKGHQVRVEDILDEWLQNVQANKPRFRTKPTNSKFAQVKSHHFSAPKMVAKENLIPVRIDLDMEGKKYKDLVLWNINEPYFTPEQFSKLVAEDNNLSTTFESEIAAIIKKAVSTYESVENLREECVRTIDIEVRIGNLCLQDRFEWDISEPDNSPEDFSELLCNEMGLNSEFATQIAHQIREQVALHKKKNQDMIDQAYGEQNGRFKKPRGTTDPLTKIGENSRTDPVTPETFLRPVQTVFQDDNDNMREWEPRLQTFTTEEIKKHVQLEERRTRHERRGHR